MQHLFSEAFHCSYTFHHPPQNIKAHLFLCPCFLSFSPHSSAVIFHSTSELTVLHILSPYLFSLLLSGVLLSAPQHSAIKIIHLPCCSYYLLPLLKSLFWFLAFFQIQHEPTIFTFKTLHDSVLSLAPHSHIPEYQCLCFSSSHTLSHPKISLFFKCLHTFSLVVPYAQNSSSACQSDATSLTCFRSYARTSLKPLHVSCIPCILNEYIYFLSPPLPPFSPFVFNFMSSFLLREQELFSYNIMHIDGTV